MTQRAIQQSDSDIGAMMSGIAEERYNLSMMEEAKRIVEGKTIMLATKEHLRCLLEIIKDNTSLIQPTTMKEAF